MSVRQIHRVRRTALAVTAVAVLALAAGGCGNGSGEAAGGPPSGETPDSRGEEPEGSGRVADDSRTVVTLSGPEDVVLDVNSVVRDSGGFVTVNGLLRNTGDEAFYGTSAWTGPELDLKRGAGGGSLGGATLVDRAEKKRYYVLRDTESRPLATTGIASVEPNSRLSVFMQFPAPPESTTEVDLQIPTFQNATVDITEE